jgi:hypothetical protein
MCHIVSASHDTLFNFIIYTTMHSSLLWLIVRSWLDVPTFATTRRLHACHHARAPSGGRWNCGRKMSGKFCLNSDFQVTFRDLLHAVKLRHGTDGFTSSPKEGVLRIFCPKNPTGLNPQTWVPKASTLPLVHRSLSISRSSLPLQTAACGHALKTVKSKKFMTRKLEET